MQRLLRDTRGGAAIITAVCGAVLAGVAAIAVDLGILYFEARKCQTAADLAALAGARDIENADAAARATAGSNVDVSAIAVTRGAYVADRTRAATDRFAPQNGGAAVRVAVTTRAPLFFGAWIMGRHHIDVTRIATAAAEPMAAYSIGSRLAGLDGGMVNGLLSALTGSQVRLSVMDYDALASADVSLLDYFDVLASELDIEAGRFDQLLSAQVTSPQALRAISTVLAANDQAGEAALVERLAQGADANRTLALGQLLGLDSGVTPASLNVQVEALDLAGAALTAANTGRQLALNLGADIGISGLDATLAIGERANQSPWMTVTNEAIIVRTAQTRLFLRARAGYGSGSLSSVSVPVYVELASAEARLETLACAPEQVSLEVRPSVGQMALGEVDTSRLNRFSQALTPTRANLVQAPLLTVSAFGQINLGGEAWQSARFTRDEIDGRVVKTVSTNDLATGLTRSLMSDASIDVRLSGLGATAAARDLIAQQTSSLLVGLAGPLDDLLAGIGAVTGARLGQADVRVTGLRCGAPVLVG